MLEGLVHIVVGALLILGVGGIANLRGRRETAKAEGARLSLLTRVMMLLAFGGLGATIASAALTRAWPLNSGAEGWAGIVLNIAGIPLIILGACIVIAVFAGSRKRTWAVDTDKLATTGIYGRTRNPRALGWFLIYVGVALATGSGAVLVLAALFLLGYLPWILAEERALERHFGEEYRAYRERTPRFI